MCSCALQLAPAGRHEWIFYNPNGGITLNRNTEVHARVTGSVTTQLLLFFSRELDFSSEGESDIGREREREWEGWGCEGRGQEVW